MTSAVSSANPHNVAIKRIMREYAELQATPSQEFVANPLDDNLFEWHFTIAGAQETDYAGGRYHGRILLPSQYPFKPPDIMMLTPSGRFETNKKICLSISSFHPKNWQPSWSIRTVLTALIAFFPSPPGGAIGSLDYSSSEKRAYAHRSGEWTCELCAKCNKELLPYTQQNPAPKHSKFEPSTSTTTTAAAAAAAAAAATTTNIQQQPQPQPQQPPSPSPSSASPHDTSSSSVAPLTPVSMSSVSPPTAAPISSPKPSQLTFSYAPATPLHTPAMSQTMAEPTTETSLSQAQGEQKQHQQPQAAAAAAAHASPHDVPAPAPLPTPMLVPVPAPPAPSPSVRDSMSHMTVILAFLIVAILLRKLIAHINARAAVFDLTSDWELD